MKSKSSIVTSAADGCGKPSSIRPMDNLPSRDHKGAEYKESFMFSNRSSVSRGCSLAAVAFATGGLFLAVSAGIATATTTYPAPGPNDMINDGTFQPNTWFTGNSGVGSEQTTTPAGAKYAGELNISSSGYAGGADLRSHASDPQNFKLSNGSYVNVDGKTATISWDWEWSGLNTNNPLPAGAPIVGAYVQLRFFSLQPASGQNEAGAFLGQYQSSSVTGSSAGYIAGTGSTGFINETATVTIPSNAQSMDFTVNGGNYTDSAGNFYYLDTGHLYIANVDVEVPGVTNVIPEPPVLGLLGIGGLGLLLLPRRRRPGSPA